MDEGDSGTDETEDPGDDAGTESGVPTPESGDGEEAVGGPGEPERETADADDDGTGHQGDEPAAETTGGEGQEGDETQEAGDAVGRGDDRETPDDDGGAENEEGQLDEERTESQDDVTDDGRAEEGPEDDQKPDESSRTDATDGATPEGQEAPPAEGTPGTEPESTADGDTDSEGDAAAETEPGEEESSDLERATEVDAPADEIVFDPEAGPHEPEGEGPPSEPPEGAAEATPAGDADTHAVDGGETPPGEATEEVPVPGGATPPSPSSPETGGDFGPGAPDDEEMPLAAHIEEMIKRLAVVIVIMAIVSAITFPFADRLINFLWYSFLPGFAESCPAPTELANSGDQACPRLYHPLSLMLARLKTASLLGLVIALPVFVYETYLFMRPGLYPNERRYYLAAVPTSLVLAGVGIAFAYFLVLPVIFTYFLGYSMHAVDTIAFSLSETFDLILLMMGLFAVVFQIPLFMMLAIMMGVTTRRWLVRRRIYFWGGFLGLAFLFSPDPTGMAPFIVAITMVVLFEGTLLLLRWTGR